ncbi:hexose-6-phosphate isomerase [Purpureocillium lavendulum]|uniref:Mannose-6-phosphate isomerase n=1 Tax=Purpureocillium lavendulum TaxID=1247861 RepID=A0AB34FTA8_9HYPO|nr:hexose-6-phosphate isomerase [Purpureocillium lavendulum]
MADAARLFQLFGTCNNYPWGKQGRESLAAQLREKSPGTPFTIEADQFYSELWFGDYPDFPARVLESEEPLASLLQENPDQLLGEYVIRNLDGQLPFLPKILSIAKALPLQVHPNKKLSEHLHRDHPDQYTDPNHKPEIAVALSRFEVFAGWKPINIISALFNTPKLRQFVPENTQYWSDETLREVVRRVLKADDKTIRKLQDDVAHMSERYLEELHEQGYMLSLLPRLQDQYSATDPGSLVALLCMNYMVLEPGEALYIPADGIHAYLSGDIVECMARSNNVLNTGFCPRADRDSIGLFAQTLTFSPDTQLDNVKLPAKKSKDGSRGHTSVYQPPISEFDMLRIDLRENDDEEVSGNRGPGIAIVTRGEGRVLGDGKEFEAKEGYIFYIAPGTTTTWRTTSGLQVHAAVVHAPPITGGKQCPQ